MNGERISKTVSTHAEVVRDMADALGVPKCLRDELDYHVLLADHADRGAAAAVTAIRRGISPSLERQVVAGQETAYDLEAARNRRNLIHLDAERARRRGPERLPGA